MDLPEYEYKGLMAKAWDILRGDTSNWADRALYLELVHESGQPALDVGCGTGRLLLDFMRQGFDIDGVDNSPEMLAICREKATALGLSPALYEQYLETMSLPRRYRTILIPSSSIQLITDPAQAGEAMRRCVEHLEPGGLLAASFMTLWQAGDPLESEWEHSVTRPEDNATIRRYSQSWFNPATECESTKDLYQIIVDGSVVAEEVMQRSPATRSYSPDQARRLFESAGLVDVELFTEFSREPVKPEDTLFTAIGRRSGLR